MRFKRFLKYAVWALIGAIAAAAIVAIVSYEAVVLNAHGKTFDNVHDIPATEVGLLLGTTPYSRLLRAPNYFFVYRIEAAERLYKSGKVKYICVSGDEHSLDGIDEPRCMKDSLMARGIPAEVIFTDGKGYRTLDSVVRLNKVYGARSFTIISQRFHNERAIYLAEHLGLDINKVYAFNAGEPTTAESSITYAREFLARVKMHLDIITGTQPKAMEAPTPYSTLVNE